MDHEFCLVAIPRTLQQGNYHETDTQQYLGGHYAARLHYLLNIAAITHSVWLINNVFGSTEPQRASLR